MKKYLLLMLLFSMVFTNCDNTTPTGDPTEDPVNDDYDRKAMLTNWADNIIIPGYENYTNKTQSMQDAVDAFKADPTQSNLDALRDAWYDAYFAWQRVTQFLYLKGDELNLRINTNIYPTNVSEIESNIASGNYDLTLSSNNDSQGFPAMDYMLYGLGSNDTEILGFYTTNGNAAGYVQYLVDLAYRLHDLASTVYDDWNSGFKDEFINNDGRSSNSSTNRVVNDYIFYYEKDLRAGKVGLPAGIWASAPISDIVEAYYKNDISKELCLEALDAAQDFFNGKSFDGSKATGNSLKSYLDYLKAEKNGEMLSDLINDQFDSARAEINKLQDSFSKEVEQNNDKMLAAYAQLQLNVVLLKTDMLQWLNINTDFVDSDGD